MADLPAIRVAAEQALGAAVRELVPVGGGALNAAFALRTSDGRQLFVKHSADALPGSYSTEAAGLCWLAAAAPAGAPRTPVVAAVVDPQPAQDAGLPRMLILEWIEQGTLGADGVQALGHELATLHRAGAPHFGALPPGTEQLMIGPVLLPVATDPSAGWPEVYGQLRLLPAARIAQRRGALPASGLAALSILCERLDTLVGPAEPPARLHGDLWSGNVVAGRDGAPWLVDPAAWGGHREIDLAMLALFGGVDQRYLHAYDEVYPLAEGWRERVALYQLFPLLVHAALWGGGYGDRALAIVRRYAGRR